MNEFILLLRHETLNFLKLIYLYKTLKATTLAITDWIVLNYKNTELLVRNIQKNHKLSLKKFNIIDKEIVC